MTNSFGEKVTQLFAEMCVGSGTTAWEGGKKGKKPTGSPLGKTPISPLSPATPATPMTPISPTDSVIVSTKEKSLEFGLVIKQAGVACLKEGILDQIKKAGKEVKNPANRLGAMSAIQALVEHLGREVEPYTVSLLPIILDCLGDKTASVRRAATDAGQALVSSLSKSSVRTVTKYLYGGMASSNAWQTKEGALKFLTALAAGGQLANCLADIVPIVSECMWDIKDEVKKAAKEALNAACAAVENNDIQPFIPHMVACIANPDDVPETIYKLAATTFVQAVKAPVLAVIVPLLIRGLRHRETPVKRQTTVIIDSMAKLVTEPQQTAPFLAKLLPELEKVRDETSDPECRNVASKAHAALVQIGQAAETDDGPKRAELAVVLKALKASCLKVAPCDTINDEFSYVALEYVATMGCHLVDMQNWEPENWAPLGECLVLFVGTKGADAAAADFLQSCYKEATAYVECEEDEGGEDLCNCEFSLAYGGKILLNQAKLWLKRGKRYGLCGPNDVGKSTLMRSIANGQLQGFPPPDELRCVYVEHDIQASQAELNVTEFVMDDPKLKNVSKEEIQKTLSSVGFTDQMQIMPVTSLSGGWKMKLALARAMLMKADILLLDEPTNHLDVKNVAWIENYLISLTNVTSIIVSHDSGLLDHVCTHIIHFENKKLRKYKGNLAEFVKVKPEAKSYYSLMSSRQTFRFPEPGFLEGVKSKSKVVLRMRNVGFTYPGTTRKIITGASIYCSLQSRVAVLGANGAGKSTMIKILLGELIADEGEVTRHPNLRVAYLAQHAFHHLEQHLNETPNQYIQWRYAGGEDKEGIQRAARQVSEEERKVMEKPVTIVDENGASVKRVAENLMGRRHAKKDYEYEVKWANLPHEQNSWLSREKLEQMGWKKIMQKIDEREASRAGAYAKPLTQAEIQKHLENVGLEAEFAVHTQIRALSGGQKVKVVLAAAMWNNPHVLILDEPTNYLDRDSLGALAGAIREFGGGVLMISHHSEFTEALCEETWIVEDGKVTPRNQPEEFGGEQIEDNRLEEQIDAAGNVIKLKVKKELSRKERIARDKERKRREAAGEPLSSDDED